MADFAHVHRYDLAGAKRSLQERLGERWNVILKEPMRFEAPMSETATFVTLMLGRDGKLHPADQGSADAVAEWKERHKETANESFEFPDIAGARK